MLKEKVVFIIALILVVFGVSYLGLTLYKFIKVSSKKESSVKVQNSTQEEDISGLELLGSSNKEILEENANIGDSVKIDIKIKNTTEEQKQIVLEGRVYSVPELLSFPNIDSDLPLDTKSFSLTIAPQEISETEYSYTIADCGNFYMAIADKNFWSSGRGLVSYGYFSVDCSQKASTVQQGSKSNDFFEDTPGGAPTTKGGLTLYDKKKQELEQQQSSVLGVSSDRNNTTKGGVALNEQTPEVTQLPKAGSQENLLILFGVSLITLGFLKLKSVA